MKSEKFVEKQLKKYYKKAERTLTLPPVTKTVKDGQTVQLYSSRRNPFVSAAAFAIYAVGLVSMIILFVLAGGGRDNLVLPGLSGNPGATGTMTSPNSTVVTDTNVPVEPDGVLIKMDPDGKFIDDVIQDDNIDRELLSMETALSSLGDNSAVAVIKLIDIRFVSGETGDIYLPEYQIKRILASGERFTLTAGSELHIGTDGAEWSYQAGVWHVQHYCFEIPLTDYGAYYVVVIHDDGSLEALTSNLDGKHAGLAWDAYADDVVSREAQCLSRYAFWLLDYIYHPYKEIVDVEKFKNNRENLMEQYFDSWDENMSVFSGFIYPGLTGWDELFPEGPHKLFDGEETSKWCSGSAEVAGSSAVVWSMKNPVYVGGYTITTANDHSKYTTRNPVKWRLYGATELPATRMDSAIPYGPGEAGGVLATYLDSYTVPDGWVLIDAVDATDPNDPDSSLLPDLNYMEVAFAVQNPGTYKYFMLLIDICETGPTFQMAEFTLYGADTNPEPDPDPVTEPEPDPEPKPNVPGKPAKFTGYHAYNPSFEGANGRYKFNDRMNLMGKYFYRVDEKMTIYPSFTIHWDTGDYLDDHFGPEGPHKLFDGDKETKWFGVPDLDGEYAVVWDMKQAVYVNGYTITTGNDNEAYPNRGITKWRLYGANVLPAERMDAEDEYGLTYFDKATVPGGWVLIDAVDASDPNDPKTSLIPDENYFEIGFEAQKPGSYKYFMLVIDECEYCFQLSEFTLYGRETRVQEIKDAWFEQYGYEPEINAYYGEYGGKDVFLTMYGDWAETKIEVAGYIFEEGAAFDIFVYDNGRFVKLKEAYESGLLTREQVGEIAARRENLRNDESPALDLETAKKIIAKNDDIETILAEFKKLQEPDYVGGYEATLVEFRLDWGGNEKILFVMEENRIIYSWYEIDVYYPHELLFGKPLEAKVPKIDPLTDEKQTEIEDAWLADRGQAIEWKDRYGVRYYGSYGDCVILFEEILPFEEFEIFVAGRRFAHLVNFRINVYRDGKFESLENAYEKGLLTKAQVSEIADYHREILKDYWGDGYYDTLEKW